MLSFNTKRLKLYLCSTLGVQTSFTGVRRGELSQTLTPKELFYCIVYYQLMNCGELKHEYKFKPVYYLNPDCRWETSCHTL